jgi:hypothetical protein
MAVEPGTRLTWAGIPVSRIACSITFLACSSMLAWLGKQQAALKIRIVISFPPLLYDMLKHIDVLPKKI